MRMVRCRPIASGTSRTSAMGLLNRRGSSLRLDSDPLLDLENGATLSLGRSSS